MPRHIRKSRSKTRYLQCLYNIHFFGTNLQNGLVKGPLVNLNGYHSNQASECIVKVTDQVFSLDDVIARTKPIYRYKETGHPSL